MSDDFKLDILRSIRSLIRVIPKRSKSIISFVKSVLKSDSQVKIKKSALDIVDQIITELPESKDFGIVMIAEYIEDCQHAELQIRVLNIINREVTRGFAPTSIIRYVNNRLNLEEVEIRAAAVGTLFKYAVKYENLKGNILQLFQE